MKAINKSQIINIIMISLIVVIIILGYVLIDNKSLDETNSNSKIVATTNFSEITKANVIEAGGISLQEAYQKVYKLEKEIIHDFLIEKEAKKNNMSKIEFLNKYSKSRTAVSNEDINKEYERVVKKFPNVTLDQVRNKLKSDQYNIHKSFLVKELQTKYDLKIKLDTLKKISIKKNNYQDIRFGSNNAPIKLAVFSDYQCSHCKTFHQELEKRIKKFPNLIQVQYHHFPVINAFSKNLAIYGYCMHEQDKFKDFSDLVYENQGNLNYDNLMLKLSPLNYNSKKLASCLKSPMPNLALEHDTNEATNLNINSTPKVIMNGYVSTLMDLDNEIKKVAR